ncbi:MAG: metal-dependent hydrolase [Terracidiphilus sp.]
MDPLTHFLTGAAIGRAGFNRKTAYATLVAVLAAEAADIDVLWGLAGPVEMLKHHRGITHTFLAAPVIAAAMAGMVWAVNRRAQARRGGGSRAGRERGAARPAAAPGPQPAPAAADASAAHPALAAAGPPVARQKIHWGWLYATALVAALSHLLLDWTNNYGLRPFFPFNPRWYAGSLVFIADPVLWALLLLALLMPWLFGLADREMGVRRREFRGRGWAIFALTGMVLVWGWRWAEQGRARMLVENAPITTVPVARMALEPYPVNPFRWHLIVETAGFYQTAEVNTLTGAIATDPRQDVIFKPPVTAVVRAAELTPLGRVYLDWGRWAVVRDVGPVPIPGLIPPELPASRRWTTVHFTDLRFDYSYLGADRSVRRAPLDGWVYIVDGREDAGEMLDGREQR